MLKNNQNSAVYHLCAVPCQKTVYSDRKAPHRNAVLFHHAVRGDDLAGDGPAVEVRIGRLETQVRGPRLTDGDQPVNGNP